MKYFLIAIFCFICIGVSFGYVNQNSSINTHVNAFNSIQTFVKQKVNSLVEGSKTIINAITDVGNFFGNLFGVTPPLYHGDSPDFPNMPPRI